MKFVISKDVIEEVSDALQAFINHTDTDCTRSGCMCDLRGEACSYGISVVLRNFETSVCVLPKKEG
jgi:hypothetical protein